VRVRELTQEFNVSNMTIRRDIEALALANRLIRVHGGATRLDRSARSLDEPGFRAKSTRQPDEKASIATAAAARIAPGSAIGVTAGTTTYQLAEHLVTISNLTVVTNSIPIASTLSSAASHDLQVVITGGSPTPSNAIVGPLADRTLSDLHLDQLFMGVHGMAEGSGFTTPNLAEAQTNQAFIRASREIVVLGDSTKWGLTGLGTIAPLAAADVLITDDAIAANAQRVLDREIVDVEFVASEE
jgi:DeoR/GlpR family transcriptional regulator of sugar metabolism